jgi:hypothetical protein
MDFINLHPEPRKPKRMPQTDLTNRLSIYRNLLDWYKITDSLEVMTFLLRKKN